MCVTILKKRVLPYQKKMKNLIIKLQSTSKITEILSQRLIVT